MKPVQHWKCEICKAHNDVLNTHCWSCKSYKPEWITTLYQMRVEIDRGIFDSYGILANPFLKSERRVNDLTPNEELHAKFFSEEAVLVIGMNDIDLDEHIHQLEDIAREAKARILAATEEKRNRKAKSGKPWKVEPLGPDPTVSDSLNKVRQRSSRMSKLDKMREKMSALGLSDFELDQMMSKMLNLARKDPEALKTESKMKQELNNAPIVTDEERERRIKERKALDERDKAEEKAKKESAPVHSSKDEKLILTEEKPAPSKANPSPWGNLDITKKVN